MRIVLEKIIRTILLSICIAALLFSAYMLYCNWSENDESKQLNAGIVSSFTVEEKKSEVPISVDFDGLRAQCGDVVGWLYCEGTVINYPVVQSDDNSYYLHRMLDGSYNANGTLFMDYRNDPDLGSLNTIIYGHHMRSGAMFAVLDKFSTQEFYEEHPVVWFLTPQRAYRIDLISSFVTPASSDSYNVFKTQEELHEYLSDALSRSLFKSSAPTVGIERIVTLSTCAYSYDNARTVVIGRLTPVEY